MESWKETLERQEQERAAANWAAAVAAHHQVQPSLSEDAALARNGERQLLGLNPIHLSPIGLLIASDVYRMNRLLRQGRSLETSPGMMLDWNGYATLQAFLDDVDLMFADLGDGVQLDHSIRAFRGIDVSGTPTDHSPDVAGIGSHLSQQTPWQNTFNDPGIGFATTSAEIALYYPEANHTVVSRQRVLLELEVSQALCLPQLEHQSATLFGHLVGITYLDTQVPHLIFPRGMNWDVTSIDTQSAHGVPLVKMRQRPLLAPSGSTPR